MNRSTEPFRAWDFAIETLIDLPELPRGPGGRRLSFRMASPGVSCPALPEDIHPDEPVSFRRDESVCFHFPDLAEFVVSANAAEVRCHPANGVNLEMVRHLFLDSVLPVLLTLGGDTVLHASAVAVGGQAIALVGPSGRGKSTLCAALAAAGCPVVADDALLIRPVGDRFLAVPSYPGLRLWPASASAVLADTAVREEGAKYRIGPGTPRIAFADAPLPLHRIYALEPDSTDVSVTAMSRAESLLMLVSHSFRLDRHDRHQLTGEFERLNNVIPSTSVLRLRYSRDFRTLPTVCEMIRHDVRGSPRRCAAMPVTPMTCAANVEMGRPDPS